MMQSMFSNRYNKRRRDFYERYEAARKRHPSLPENERPVEPTELKISNCSVNRRHFSYRQVANQTREQLQNDSWLTSNRLPIVVRHKIELRNNKPLMSRYNAGGATHEFSHNGIPRRGRPPTAATAAKLASEFALQVGGISKTLTDKDEGQSGGSLDVQLKTKIADKITDKTADKIPDKMANNVADKIPDKMASNVADKIPNKMANNVADKMMNKVPDKKTDKMAVKMPDKMPDKMADKMVDKMVDKMGDKLANNKTDKMTEKVADKKADQLAEDSKILGSVNIKVEGVEQNQAVPQPSSMTNTNINANQGFSANWNLSSTLSAFPNSVQSLDFNWAEHFNAISNQYYNHIINSVPFSGQLQSFNPTPFRTPFLGVNPLMMGPHPPFRVYTCPMESCKQNFDTRRAMYKHQRETGHHAWSHNCIKCGQVFRTAGFKRMHSSNACERNLHKFKIAKPNETKPRTKPE
ncbi:uncharacterized protein LOC6526143 isoform X2 [Drosophila yakuba]|uniref:uncharacterized protein LOC6526143 isoform X2 n=1 Tax=Drosophila yakuba TaxID=7245 RepID=UPI0019307AE5|nr:uncharacterized protein LOC6526143 isoform X2 [Drosophila yakuba]